MSPKDREIITQEDPKTVDSNDILIDKNSIGTDLNYKHTYVWYMVLAFVILHILGIQGYVYLFTGRLSLQTFLWTFFVNCVVNQSITIGAHRYYTHRAFKARLPLQVMFIFGHTLAGQNALRTWVRDHRLHHRFSDTDADPHNAARGFFFSHIGWLMMRKHPLVRKYGKTTDISDLLADPLVNFQYKYYGYLYILIGCCLPVMVPVWYWGETWTNSIVAHFARYAHSLHCTWLVNSWAHLYGDKPYDKGLNPRESKFVSYLTFGEGWHNFHHIFPWDYRAAESDSQFNLTASSIRFLEKIGLVYDLKTAPRELIEKKILQTGDGSHYSLDNKETTAW